MLDDYFIVPKIEHYGCMVDLLGRSGLLDQAMNSEENAMEADAVIGAALLGRVGYTRTSTWRSWLLKGSFIELEPKIPANYVMLSNINLLISYAEVTVRR